MQSEYEEEWIAHFNKSVINNISSLNSINEIVNLIRNVNFNKGLFHLIPKSNDELGMIIVASDAMLDVMIDNLYYVFCKSPALTYDYIVENQYLPWVWSSIFINKKFTVEQFINLCVIAYTLSHRRPCYIDLLCRNTNITIDDVIKIKQGVDKIGVNGNTYLDLDLITYREEFTVQKIIDYPEYDWMSTYDKLKPRHVPDNFFDNLTSSMLKSLGKLIVRISEIANYPLADIRTMFPKEYVEIMNQYGSDPLELTLDKMRSKDIEYSFMHEKEAFVRELQRKKHNVLFQKCLIEMRGVFLNPDNFNYDTCIQLDLGIPTDQEWKQKLVK